MKEKRRVFRVDNDSVEVLLQYDDRCRVWLGEYPYFEEEPRQTPQGRPWRNVSFTGCPHGAEQDCGSCAHFVREEPNDMIGVCFK